MELSDGEDSDTSVDFLHESVDQSKSFKFSPVDHTWRKDCCSKLGLEFNSDQADNQYDVFQHYAAQTNLECGMEELPEVVGEVVGDGNCLFRALCHVFTAGSEDQHPRLRQLICSFMQFYQESFARIRGETVASFTRYIERMQENYEWGTDVELLGCATMLQTAIATYLDGKWVFYFPCFRLDGQSTRLSASQPLENTNVIYLLNINKHYSPVISIKDEMSYVIEHEKIKTRLQIDSLSTYLAEKAVKCKQWTQDQLKQEVEQLFYWLSNLPAVKSNKISLSSKQKQSNRLRCVNTTFISVPSCRIDGITLVEKPAVKPQNFVVDLSQEATSEIEEGDEEGAEQSPEAGNSNNSQEVHHPNRHCQPSSTPRLIQPRKAFNYYMSEHRYRIRKTYPHLAKNEVNTQALKEWNRLQDKSKYHMLALEDKMRYEEEKQCGFLPRPTKTRKTRLSK